MSAYRGRRVLVVGGLGFIGANVTAALMARGASVTIVTPSRARHRDAAIECETGGARVLEDDVRDRDAMAAAVRGQSVVFNLAGQSGAVQSMDDPWTDLDVNCRGMLSLVEAMRAENRDAKVVFTGSRLAYGRVGDVPVAEAHQTDPLCLHAVHKLAAEEYLRLYSRLFGIRYAVARITNPYGPGQPPGRTAYGIVNRLIQLAVCNETLTIYGSGCQRRDNVYIDDVVEALLRLGDADSSGVYNVGTGIGTSIADVARTIVDLAGGGRIESVEWPSLAGQIETGDFVADVSRIRDELGWHPSVSLGDGLQRTIAYLRAHVAP